ncbi:MAG TPA: Gfo/Idh/MocA family oxidoreductase [Candidatus Limnocylindria bacterium]|nr:Gfo/Idh/MocA family oxidoreductase [Candidatus Limnocylindria bacterium]
MTDSPRLHTAVIGTGFVGPHHVDAVRRTGYADVAVLVGSNPDRTARRAADLGVDQWSTDSDAVLADASIDVVHVCTPNHTHVSLGRAVLEAGKHLVLEKPIAVDQEGAESLVGAAARSDRHAMVALTYRGYPMVQQARSMVAEGQLGDIRLVRGAYIQDWLADAADYNWRVDPAVGGPSRAVADIGTHWFDTAEFVTGLRVAAVQADLVTFLPMRSRSSNEGVAFSTTRGPAEDVAVDSEDAATMLFRFAGGARGICVVSQVSTGNKNAFSLDIDGSLGSLRWEQELPERLSLRERGEERLFVRDPGAQQASAGVPWLPAGHPEGWGEALRDLLRPFYAAVASGAPPLADGAPYPTLEDGARSIAFVEATLESSAAGSWMTLED